MMEEQDGAFPDMDVPMEEEIDAEDEDELYTEHKPTLPDFDLERLIKLGKDYIHETTIWIIDPETGRKEYMPVYIRPLTYEEEQSLVDRVQKVRKQRGAAKKKRDLVIDTLTKAWFKDKEGIDTLSAEEIKDTPKGVPSQVMDKINRISFVDQSAEREAITKALLNL